MEITSKHYLFLYRSWWMIGAVVVGALMVGLAKVAFPEVFDIVIEFFKSMIPTQLG